MIDKQKVTDIVEEWLHDKEYFLVDVEVSTDDRIIVEIDHSDGVWIEDCVTLSRYIEERLDREEHDYELEVGSAGLGQPFKVLRQYLIHIGKEVEVLAKNGKKYRGVLASADKDKFSIISKAKVKVEGKKRPEIQDVEVTFTFDEVKETKYHISF